jgi:hypothetical protein
MNIPKWVWIVAAIIVVIIIIVIVVVMTSSTSSTSSTPLTQLPPTQLTITWTNMSGQSLVSKKLPDKGIYMLTPGTSLESYNVAVSTIMSLVSPGGFTVKYLYNITGDYPDIIDFDASNSVFLKYVDSDDVNRFALVLIYTDSSSEKSYLIIYTADDVGTSIDPAKYIGNWLSTNNNLISVNSSPLTNEKLIIT